MDRDVHIRVLKSLPELEEIRDQWEAWGGNRDSQIDCYLSLLQSRSDVLRPHVIVLYRGGQADTILVGRLDCGTLDFKVGYLHFRPKATVLYFVYGALRGNASDENSRLVVNEICRSLAHSEADAAYLNFLPTDSHVYKLARNIPAFFSRDHVCEAQPHYSTGISNSVEDFYRALSPNARWQIRNKQKRLLRDLSEAVTIRCFREPCEVDDLIQDVEEVAHNSYQRGLGVGFVDSEETRHRLRLKAKRGWLRGYVLYTAGQASAFWIGDINDGIFGSDYLAYDEAMGKYSPGMYLMSKVIEGFCKDGSQAIKEIDFATGHAQYKKTLSTREWQEAAVYIFAPSLRGLYLNGIRYMTGRVTQIVKAKLGRTLLFQRTRKRWRRAARLKAITQD
jgi:Acetyltransferase (GNAT) domain